MTYSPGDPRPADKENAPRCVRIVNISSKPLPLKDLIDHISTTSNPITVKDILALNPRFRAGSSETIAPGKDVFVPGFYYTPGVGSQIGGKRVSDDAGADWKVTQWANQNLFGPVPNEGCWARVFGATPRKSIIRIVGKGVYRNRDKNGNRFNWNYLLGEESE